MAIVKSKERFFDGETKGSFGRGWEYGQKIYGQGYYGEEEIEIPLFGYGIQLYGLYEYGSDNQRWGIYQKRYSHWAIVDGKRKYFGKRKHVRESFYQCVNPQYPDQQNWRNVFKLGMDDWKALTSEKRQAYNKEAHKLKLHGVNLFLRRWLKSY